MAGAIENRPRCSERILGFRGVQVKRYVEQVIASDGVAPSYGMICAELGISSRAKVHCIIKRLESRGVLRRVGSGRVRRIQLG